MGHVTLHAGIAGGADVILLPEIPYDIDVVTDVIQKRAAADKKFTIIAVAEGAISKEDARLKEKRYKEKLAKRNIRPSPTNWQRRSSRRQTRK